jgi:septum site-determining protein MinC
MPVSIAIKGIKEGLLITLGEAENWETASRALQERIDQSADFFKGARVALAIGNRALSAADLGHLRDVLSERTVSLWAVLSDSAHTFNAAQALGLNVALPTSMPVRKPDPETNPDESRETATLVSHTLRSGRRLHTPGHAVVIGDVNPGAEIVAGGNIVVWGRLRGVAHAGANGDETMVVCALDLAPTQLRIADHIATSPARKGAPKPELARIKDGHIVAEQWNANLKSK